MRVVFIKIFLFVFCKSLLAQQEPAINQFFYNKAVVNPAFNGIEGYTSFDVLHFQKWAGVSTSPYYSSVSFQTRLRSGDDYNSIFSLATEKELSRNGIGFNFFNNANGHVKQTGGDIAYSYILPFKESKLAFGIDFKFYQYYVNKDNFEYFDEDKLLQDNDLRWFVPDASLGVYYSSSDYYIGISGYNLLRSPAKNSLKSGTSIHYDLFIRYYNFLSGFYFDISPFWYNETALLLRYSEFGQYQYKLMTSFFYNQNLWIGPGFSGGYNSYSLAINIGSRVSKIVFGYSFAFNLNQISGFSLGTHELVISYRFNDNKRRYKIWN